MIKMKPRYFIHMGPRSVQNVSPLWKVAHILVFILLTCSSSVASVCIYNILDMYNFHCIIYAKVSFEQSYKERLKEIEKESATETGNQTDISMLNDTTTQNETIPDENNINSKENRKRGGRAILPDCTKNPTAAGCKNRPMIQPLRQWKQRRGKFRRSQHVNETLLRRVKKMRFLNMRKTIFATTYMCNLMLFAPLTSIIMAIFLGALIAVGGKGGSGNPGDLLPNPWICVYPFVALCALMIIFCYTSDNLYHSGLRVFCLRHQPITNTKWCSEKMDPFNVQFSKDQRGPPKPFYMTFVVGSISVQVTLVLWIIQTVVYVLRILCLADFTVYLTRIRLKSDEGRPERRMASVVIDVLDAKKK